MSHDPRFDFFLKFAYPFTTGQLSPLSNHDSIMANISCLLIISMTSGVLHFSLALPPILRHPIFILYLLYITPHNCHKAVRLGVRDHLTAFIYTLLHTTTSDGCCVDHSATITSRHLRLSLWQPLVQPATASQPPHPSARNINMHIQS